MRRDDVSRLPLLLVLPASGLDQLHALRSTADPVDACKESTLSEGVQRSHFSAFFAVKYAGCCPLPPDASMFAMMRVLADGLRKMSSSIAWFRLQLHIKARRTLRRRAHCLVQTRTKRTETLDSWLNFWCAAEARIQQAFRQQLQSPVTLQEVRRGQCGHIARAVTPVADSLKVQVVWEVYWILRAQYTHRLKLHCQRLLALFAQRKEIRHRRAMGLYHSNGDFWQGEARSLRAINAAIFLSILQEPKFHYAVGRDIRATELLRLANANLEEGSWVELADSPLGPQGCPTMLAFLRSSLLVEPHWLKVRSKQTSAIVPPRTWSPARLRREGRPMSPPSPASAPCRPPGGLIVETDLTPDSCPS
eukprot:EG_transcript_17336